MTQPDSAAPRGAPPLLKKKAATEPRDPSPPLWVATLVEQAQSALVLRESAEARVCWSYLAKRGLAEVAVNLYFGVVDNSVVVPEAGSKLQNLRGRLVLPTMVDGKAVWFKARHIGPLSDEEAKSRGIFKYDGPSGSVPAPFNANALKAVVRL